MVTGHNKIGHVTLIVYFFNVLVTRSGPVLVSVVAMSARKKTDTIFAVILGNGESRFAFVISNTAICKKIPASNFGAGDFFYRISIDLILFMLKFYGKFSVLFCYFPATACANVFPNS